MHPFPRWSRLALAVLACLLLPGVPGAVAQETDDEPTLVERARDVFRSGRYEDALRAIAEEDSRDAVLLRIRIRGRVGSYDEAIAEAEEAVERWPEAGLVQLALARALDRRGRFEEALEALERGRELRPEDPTILAEHAEALLEAGDPAGARETIEEVLSIYREAATLDHRDLLGCAAACRLAQRFDAIRSRFRRPMAAYARRMYDEARQRPSGAEDPIVWARWASLYADKFDYPEARRLFERALEIDDRLPEALIGLAEANIADGYEGTERYTRARALLDRADDVNPSAPTLRVARGALAFVDGDLESARTEAQAALDVDPRSVEALALLGAVRHMEIDREGFEAVEDRARGLGARLADFYWQVAKAIEGKYQFRQAADLCQRALLVDDGFWPAMTTLGINLTRMGEEERGRSFLERAHEADPYNIFCFNTLQVLDELDENYVTRESEHFRIRIHAEQEELLLPLVKELLEEAWDELSERYDHEPEGKILFEMFSDVNWFSARTVGLPFIGASGVCFGKVVAMWSPQIRGVPPGAFTWGATLWHELAHVFTVERSGYRVPRWFTEGLSVLEETNGRPYWVRPWDKPLLDALAWDRILPVAELDSGFTRPRFPGQVLLSYFQGGRICQFIERMYGWDAILEMLDGYRRGLSTSEVIREVLGADPDAFDEAFRNWLADGVYGDYRYRARARPSDVRRLRRRVEENPEDAEALGSLALAHAERGRRADAEIAAGRALDLDMTVADAHLALGYVHLGRDETERGREAVERAIALGTSDPMRAHARLAGLVAEEDPRAALEHVHEALAAFPTHPNLLRNRLALEQQLGLEEAARETMERITEVQSEAPQVRVALLQAAVEEGDRDAIERWARQLVWLQPTVADAHYQLARLANLRGDGEEALRGARAALAAGHGNAIACRAELLEAHVHLGELEEAREVAFSILEQRPEHERATEVLSAIEAGETVPPREEPVDEGEEEPDEEEAEPREETPPEGRSPPEEPAPEPEGPMTPVDHRPVRQATRVRAGFPPAPGRLPTPRFV